MKFLPIIKIFTVSADLIGQNRLGNDVLYYLRGVHAGVNVQPIKMQIGTFLVENHEKFEKAIKSPLTEKQRRKQRQRMRIKYYRQRFLHIWKKFSPFLNQ